MKEMKKALKSVKYDFNRGATPLYRGKGNPVFSIWDKLLDFEVNGRRVHQLCTVVFNASCFRIELAVDCVSTVLIVRCDHYQNWKEALNEFNGFYRKFTRVPLVEEKDIYSELARLRYFSTVSVG